MKKSKQEILKEAIKKFKKSEKTSKDYLEFIQISTSVMRQGDGLVWSQVEEILKESFEEEGE